jgi:Tol biopolymer transport system component
MHADLDRLISDDQRLALETHLAGCEACRADSDSLSTLTSRLQSEFHERWDAQDGPSQQIMSNVRSQTRRIVMSNRINFGLKALAGIAVLLVLGFGLNTVISQMRDHSTAANGATTPDDKMPASSADAKKRLLAFTQEVDGNYDIYTIRADGSGLTNLTNNPAFDANPFWSPDGKRIAFESDRTGLTQIYLMDADGSNIIQLTNDEIDHTLPTNFDGRTNPWSPDGRQLWISSFTDVWNLYKVNTNGSGLTSLIAVTLSSAIMPEPHWSPDGEKIAFFSNDSDNPGVPRIYIVDANGENWMDVAKMLPQGEQIAGRDFYWSHDGQSIIFFAHGKDGYYVYEARLDGSLTEQLSGFGGILLDWRNGKTLLFETEMPALTWLHDGTISTQQTCQAQTVSYTRSNTGRVFVGIQCLTLPDAWSLYISNEADNTFQKIPALSLQLHAGDMLNQAWSPDDKFIVFTLGSSSTNNLYILNVEESLNDPSIQPLKLESSFGPSWQPVPVEETIRTNEKPTQLSTYDGLIAFTSAAENGNTDIYSIRPDGNGLINITNNPANDSNPAWSPNGNKLSFVSDRDGDNNIYVMNPDGGDLTQLTDNPGYDGYFSWSLDGTKIIYSASSGSDANISQLIVMNADGTNKVTLTDPGSYMFLGWSPNGQKIVYLKQNLETNPQDDEIHVMNIDGTNHYQWRAIIDEIKWTDDQHFIGHGWSGQVQSPTWKISRFDANGSDPIELATIPGRVVALFNQTYVVEDTRTLNWYSSDGAKALLKSWDYSTHCQKGGDRFMQDTSHIISPDGARAFVIVHCGEDVTWFYLESASGSNFVQLTDFSIPAHEQVIYSANWSPDGKYVIMTIANKDNDKTDLYLFDLEKMLKDITTQPIRLTTDETVKFEAIWQPQP